MKFLASGVIPDSSNTGISGVPNTVIQDGYSGQFLFYTNGTGITNRNHQIMPNGGMDSLANNYALAFPLPNDSALYYVVHMRLVSGDTDSVRFSIVDMNLDSGLGDIDTTVHAIVLKPSAYHGFAATSATGVHFGSTWLALVDRFTKKLEVYRTTQHGIVFHQSTPSGIFPDSGNALLNISMTITFSPEGKFLALRRFNFGFHELHVYEFHSEMGELGNAIHLKVPTCWGLEFSPDNHYLYYTSGYSSSAQDPLRINQLCITPLNPDSVLNSHCVVHQGTVGGWGHMKLGPDGRIYVARHFG